jgi:hypothetical protein
LTLQILPGDRESNGIMALEISRDGNIQASFEEADYKRFALAAT